MEKTFVMVKPDGVQRGLVGEVIARLERKGLKLVALKLVHLPRETAEKHYAPHRDRPFFAGLIRFITSGPVVAMVWEGERAVSAVRSVMGATDPVSATPGTLRGDYGLNIGMNIVHGSDSVESAGREIAIFFKPGELFAYDKDLDRWVTEG